MRKQSQKKRILEYLQAGNKITPIEALNLFGCFRLSDIIFRLKAEGHNIHTEIVRVGDKHFGRYTLNDWWKNEN